MEIPTYHPFRSAEAKAEYLAYYDKSAKAWPVVSESKTVDTSYGQTFVRISGPVDAPPLVLLPGAATNSLMWVTNIGALSERYRTYAVDSIYDYGRSVYTQTIKSADDFVNWLDDLLRALEPGKHINLIGMSYGGWLTSRYALVFPDRLDKIVLLAPAATVLSIRLQFLIRGMLMGFFPFPIFVKSMMYWLSDYNAQQDKAARMQIENLVESIVMGARCFEPKRMVAPTVLKDKELQSITVPALYLIGENDKMYSAQKAVQRLNREAPGIKTHIIPNAGHDLIEKQAAMVNRMILAFLKQS